MGAFLPNPDANTPRPCILVVEDDALIRLDIMDAFRLAGWRVLEAASGEAALISIDQHKPCVIFTDINLGGCVTGWEVGGVGSAHGAEVVYTSGEASARASLPPNSAFFMKPYAAQLVVQSCWRAITR